MKAMRVKTRRVSGRSLRHVYLDAVFSISCEVYSWIRMILALVGLTFLAATLLVPQFSLSFGTFRLTPTADQLMSCYAVEGTKSTWVCDSPLGSRRENLSGDTSLTQF